MITYVSMLGVDATVAASIFEFSLGPEVRLVDRGNRRVGSASTPTGPTVSAHALRSRR